MSRSLLDVARFPPPPARVLGRAQLVSAGALALSLGAALIVTLPHSPANMPYVWPDAGTFLYTGKRLLAGDALYRQVWDQKPPLIYYLNALGLALAGGSRWGVWALEYLAVASATVLSVRLLRVFGALAAFAVTAMWLLSFFAIIDDGNMTETFVLPLQFSCLLLAYDVERNHRGRYRGRGVLIGALLALIFFCKTNAIGIGLAIAAYLILRAVRTRRWRAALVDLGAIALGFLPVAAAVLVSLAAQASLPDFWQAVFVFNLAYASRFDFLTSRIESLIAAYNALSLTGLAPFGLLGLALGLHALAFARARIPPALRPLLGLAAIALPLEVLLVTTTGRSFDHYFTVLLYAFAAWAAWFFYLVLQAAELRLTEPRNVEFPVSRNAGPAPTRTHMTLAASLGLALGVTLVPAASKDLQHALDLHSLEPPAVVEFLQAHSGAQDTVLVLGYEPRILFFADRRAPTRFVHQNAFEVPGFVTPALVEEYYTDVLGAAPAWIVDPTDRGLVNSAFLDIQVLRRRMYKLQQLYPPYGRVAGWMVYQRAAP